MQEIIFGTQPMTARKPVSLNLNVRGLGQSATLAINQSVRALRAAGRTLYNLGLGQSPFPVPVPVVEALRLHAPEKDYLPVEGLPALREAVAEFHRRKDHVDVLPENVLVGPGSKELMFLLQLVFYGEIIVPTPCWVSYLPQAKIVGRNVYLIPTRFRTGWRVTPEQLERLLEGEQDITRPRLIVLNYPQNPSGCTYSADELKAIAEVARRFEAILLSDEIYGELHHRGEHVSVARFYPEGTIISSGLSKWCGAGGWRLGTFTFPPDLRWLLEAIAAVASETYTSVSAPIQCAAVCAFRGGVAIERYLWHARRVLAALTAHCNEVLTAAGLRIQPPDGAFYLFLDFSPLHDRLAKREIHDSATLCDKLLEDTGVAMLPGVSFARPPNERTARMALIDFDGARALAASENIPLHEPLPADFVRQWCRSVIDAAERIAEWATAEG